MASQTIQIQFGSLMDSVSASKVPSGEAAAVSNCTTEHGILEGAPRFVNLSQHSSYNAGDVAWGFAYGNYNAYEEYIAIVQQNGNTFATVYSINPTTNVWSEVHNSPGGYVTSVQATASQWSITQFQDRFIASNPTGGIFYKRVGVTEWVALGPEFNVGSALDVELDVPAYPQRLWASPDTMTVSTLAGENLMAISYEKVGSQYTGRMVYFASDDYSPTVVRLAQIVVDLNAHLVLDGVDFIYFGVTPFSPASDVGHLLVSASTPLQFGLSKTANDTYANCQSYDLPTQTNYDSTNPALPIGVWVDLRSIPAADKHTGFLTLAIGIGSVWADGQAFKAYIEPLLLGGSDFLSGYYNGSVTTINAAAAPATISGDTGLIAANVGATYAYTFYNSTTLIETGATKATYPNVINFKGVTPYAGLPTGGAWAVLTPSVPSYLTINGGVVNLAGYDQIQVYRQITPTTWYCVAGIGAYDNDGNAIPALENTGTPALIDKQRAIDVTTNCRQANNLQFTDPPAGPIQPSCGTVWKAQLTLGVGELIYMSWGGNPGLFLPAPGTAFIAPAATDLAQGATFYMSQNEADPVQGVVAQDSLYLAGISATYVVIGDSALSSTPPRKLPGSRGAPGAMAVCPYSAGVLIGALDGLWFYEVSRAFTGSRDNTMAEQEMSLAVRNSWQNTLMGTNPQNLVLIDQRDCIWAFRDNVYMRYTRPTPIDGQRRWETGAWTGLTVRFANYNVLRGLRALDATGILVQIAQNASNTAYTTDNGSTVTYSYTTGVLSSAGGRKRVTKVQFQGSGTPSIEVIPSDGLGNPSPVTFTRSANGQVFIPSKTVPPGFRHQFVISGQVGRDTVEELTIWIDDLSGSGEAN